MRRNRLPGEEQMEGKRMADRIGEKTLQWIIFAIVGLIVVTLAVLLLTFE